MLLSVLWMSGALISFCLMAIGGRELAGGINTFEILFYRSLVGLLVIGLVIARSGRFEQLRTTKLPIHLGRNVVHFCAQYAWFLGLGLLPLAEVFALEFTTPFWTLIFAALLLKETLTRQKMLALALGLVGVALILNPGKEGWSYASLYVVFAAVGFALSYVSTKALSPTDVPETVVFYMCLIQLPIGLLLCVADFQWPTPLQYVWLILIGLAALLAHFCIAKAMRTTDAGVVVTLDFLRLPLITTVGIVFYGEGLNPLLILGAVVMLVGNWVNVYKPKKEAAL